MTNAGFLERHEASGEVRRRHEPRSFKAFGHANLDPDLVVAGDRREARRWAERMERDLDPEGDQGRRGTLLRAAIAAGD